MKNIIFLLAAIACFAGCKKKDTTPQLPPATHTGANTFGCMIDGKPYTVNRLETGSNPNGIYTGNYLTRNLLYIGTRSVDINCYWNSVLGTFEMTEVYPYEGYYWNYDNGTAITGSNEFKTDAVNKGAVTVTYYDGKIISGTFSFDGVNDAGIVVHITDGRFDISLN